MILPRIPRFIVVECQIGWEPCLSPLCTSTHFKLRDELSIKRTPFTWPVYSINPISHCVQLEAVDWTPVLCDMDVNRCYDSFMGILNNTIEKYVNEHTVTTSDGCGKRWITDRLRNLCRIKRQLYEEMKKNKIYKVIPYTIFCDNLKREIENSKRSTYATYINTSSNKCKATWDVVKQLQGSVKKSPFDPRNFGTSHGEGLDILNTINNHFIDSCEDIKQDANIMEDHVKYVPESFALFLTDIYEVKNAINSLSDTKATGEDGITISLLKSSVSSLAIPSINSLSDTKATGEDGEVIGRCSKFRKRTIWHGQRSYSSFLTLNVSNKFRAFKSHHPFTFMDTA
ncbi:hypothetical protein QE152_g24774 [Popillia japonica]|uniref:Uncharacterized protein n=1 Tax=Popillia japonica TaxID=7064 RepID=A0AAW1K4T6_POPJA